MTEKEIVIKTLALYGGLFIVCFMCILAFNIKIAADRKEQEIERNYGRNDF